MLCTVIHRHNDERKTAVRWQKLHKSGTMDSLRKGVPAMAIKYTEEQLNSVDKSDPDVSEPAGAVRKGQCQSAFP